MKTIIENLINFIKAIKIKHVIIALFFATIFTFFSQHWYIKSFYWQNANAIPESCIHKIEIQKENKKEYTDYFYNTNEINFENKTSDTEMGFHVYYKKDKTIQTIVFTSQKDFTETEFNIIPNIDADVILKLAKKSYQNKPIIYNSIKINDKDVIDKIQNNQIALKYETNKKLNIKITHKMQTFYTNKYNQLNYGAFLFTILFYIFTSYAIISKIKKEYLIEKLKQNKIPLIIFITFAIFFTLINGNAGTKINFFDGYWIAIGDANILLLNFVYDTAKRFHPFATLPFYPLYEFLILITQNLLVTIFTIFVIISSTTITFLYKTLEQISKKTTLINICITAFFGFSYSTILFNYSYDTYMITAMYLSIIIYLIIKNKKNITPSTIFIISLFTALSFGVTINNVIPIILIILPLFLTKQNYKKIIILFLTTLALITTFIIVKNTICYNCATNSVFYQGSTFEFNLWTLNKIGYNTFFFIKETLLKPISTNLHYSLGIILCFTIIGIKGLICSFNKKLDNFDKKIYFGLILALIYNLICSFNYASHAGLLFSQNHLILWFIIISFSIKFFNSTSNKKIFTNKIFYITLIVTIIFIGCFNCLKNKETQEYILKNHYTEKIELRNY